MIAYQTLRKPRPTATTPPSTAEDVRVKIARRAGPSTAERPPLSVAVWSSNPEHVVALRRSSWFTPVLAEIMPILELQHGWNTHGAGPISTTYVERGLAALVRLLHPDAGAPRAFPTASGGVNFEWTFPQFSLEIMAEPDCGVVISYEGDDGEWDGPVDALPDMVSDALKHLAQG